jgi:hypothetical protein
MPLKVLTLTLVIDAADVARVECCKCANETATNCESESNEPENKAEQRGDEERNGVLGNLLCATGILATGVAILFGIHLEGL